MPLFKSHRRSSDDSFTQAERETAAANHHNPDTNHRSMHNTFSRTRHSPPPESHTPPARRGSFLARFRDHPSRELKDDPAIKAAQQKVMDAEHAERDADKALELAKRAVRSAREHVRELEAAAMEEAKRARAKQRSAKSIRKGADRLGRHDNH